MRINQRVLDYERCEASDDQPPDSEASKLRAPDQAPTPDHRPASRPGVGTHHKAPKGRDQAPSVYNMLIDDSGNESLQPMSGRGTIGGN